MRLLDDFFTIQHQSQQGECWTFTVALSPNHFIFRGHFPGFPVTPAAIQLQMVHELLEIALASSIRLQTITHSKFLHVINPLETALFSWELIISPQEDIIFIRAKAQHENQTFTQLKAMYVVEDK